MYQKIILKILGLFDFFHQKKLIIFLKKKDIKNLKFFLMLGLTKAKL